MKERVIKFGVQNNLLGILTEPNVKSNNYPCIILLNAAIVHRVGPNRIHVKLARKLAQIGFSSFRFDFSGIGDSINVNNEHALQVNKNVDECIQAINKLEQITNLSFFICGGLCNAADISFKAALTDKRIIGILSINGMIKDEESFQTNFIPVAKKRIMWRYYWSNVLSIKKWYSLICGKSELTTKLKKTISFYFKKVIIKHEINQTKITNLKSTTISKSNERTIQLWMNLIKNKTKIFLLFSEGSEILEIFNFTVARYLKTYINDGLIYFKVVKDIDHIFTPVWSHDYLIDCICTWLKKVNGKQ